jgi:hypothetical protein
MTASSKVAFAGDMGASGWCAALSWSLNSLVEKCRLREKVTQPGIDNVPSFNLGGRSLNMDIGCSPQSLSVLGCKGAYPRQAIMLYFVIKSIISHFGPVVKT